MGGVSFLLVTIGVLLLLICLAGIALGAYMAMDPRSRGSGLLFAACWVSGAAGASGVIMRDSVTFLVGALCFLVAGATFGLTSGIRRTPSARGKDGPRGRAPEGSEKTTRENRSGYRRAAS